MARLESPPSGYMTEKMVMHSRTFAKFPPEVRLAGGHRYLEDVNGRPYSRDIGRSSVIGGETFFQFGDTFCKNECGDFVGLIPNTIAHVPNLSKPNKLCYQHIHSDGKVKHFLPLTADEKKWEKKHGKEAGGSRIVIWSFGGIVEESEGSGNGWCWYQKGIERKEGEPTFCGAGIAKIQLDRADNTLTAERTDEMLFPASSVSWGTFSAIRHESHYYLYGCDNSDKLYLARCPIFFPDKADAYTFWDGESFASDSVSAKPIWTKLQQGAVIRTDIFDPQHNINFMFVGNNAWADSKIQIATASAPEGPWSEFTAVGPIPGIDYKEGYRYCVYPHSWMCEPGSLGVTWSEHWPGGVILGKIQFEMQEQKKAETCANTERDLQEEDKKLCYCI